MKDCFDIVTPHEDIRQGNFDEAVFAAKLGDVVAGQAATGYNDPYAFYKKTYLTKGLEALLKRVSDKLVEGKGSAVVQLQTPFGGGKTHALILIYHYLTKGERTSELLPDGVQQIQPRIATVVGTDANASEGFRSGSSRRRTLWGELAYQLGGEEAVSSIRNNDDKRISPGRDDFRRLLEPLQPFTILLDEMLEYVVRARGVTVGDTTLDAQTLSFLQELTEAVSSLPRGMMIVTLPSSEQEDFGEAAQRNLAQIEHVFGRLETIHTPVQGEEVYSIIRRRLFDQTADESAIREVVQGYVDLYADHKNELPQKVREAEYRSKLERAYPFHPEVIDVLYEKWGTFTSFQRTRGALRLLALVVGDLYQREINLDLILPGDINLENPEIRRELLNNLGPEYESIVGSDIANGNAKSQLLDRENKTWKHLAQRCATAVFMHSFTADRNQPGIELPHVKLSVSRPDGTPTAFVTEVLQKQGNELWYLNQKGETYYFSDVPNLNKMALDRKAMVHAPVVRETLKTRLNKELGSTLRYILWPADSADIPDNHDLKLAVIDPQKGPGADDLATWVDRRSGGFRVNKNTLFFALPDGDRYGRLVGDIKEYLALKEIYAETEGDERSGMREKRSEINRRIKKLDGDFPFRIREMYRTAAVPKPGGGLEEIDLGQPAVGSEKLDWWYFNELSDQSRGKILAAAPSDRLIQAKFLSNGESVSLLAVQEQFYKDVGLPALARTEFLAEAIAAGVAAGSFGIARASDGAIVPESIRMNETIAATTIIFSDEALLVTADHARDLQKQMEAGESVVASEAATASSDGSPQAEETSPDAPAEDETVARLRLRVSGLSSNKIAELNRGVLLALTREVGDFPFTIELDVASEEGISRRVIEQQVMETLRQLGADVEVEDFE